MSLTILQGDALEKLRELPNESVQMCVTSPPYWNLRDYSVTGQIGLEPTPEDYISKLVEVFREVRRVMKSDATLWLNLGDSYCSTAPATMGDALHQRGILAGVSDRRAEGSRRFRPATPPGLKPKDLVGMPWRVALALQADGWWLRCDIIWAKKNCMPESVNDRPTRAHEYLFLLSKSATYFYDSEAIAEPVSETGCGDRKVFRGGGSYTGGNSFLNDANIPNSVKGNGPKKTPGKNSRIFQDRDPAHSSERKTRGKWSHQDPQSGGRRIVENVKEARANGADHDSPFGSTRNKRSVWTVATHAFPDAHFATYPPDLIKPCILAGSRPGDVVLDPFGGSGTTGMVALELGRKAVLIELNPTYVDLIHQRCNVTPGLALA